jgi:hypothetical protein
MLDRLRHLVFFLLLIPVAVAKAEDVTALVNAVSSFHLTAEEKALFTEATDRFKKYEIPKSIKISSVFWLDNDHLVFTALKYPGWEINRDEMPRIITYNVTTGEIADSGYRGQVRCLNHLGDILIKQEVISTSKENKKKEYKWIRGKWGYELEDFQQPENTFISLYRCNFSSYGTLSKQAGNNGYEFKRVMNTPLLEFHGELEEIEHTIGSEKIFIAQLIKPSGKRVFIRDRHISRVYFTYLPWSDSYFESRATPPDPISFTPTGAVQVHYPPKILAIWNKSIYASVAAYSSGKGILWVVQQGKNYWRKQGIFLNDKSDLFRIELGQALSDLKCSPDGCRIYARVYRGDPFKNPGNHDTILIIDLCEETNKP